MCWLIRGRAGRQYLVPTLTEEANAAAGLGLLRRRVSCLPLCWLRAQKVSAERRSHLSGRATIEEKPNARFRDEIEDDANHRRTGTRWLFTLCLTAGLGPAAAPSSAFMTGAFFFILPWAIRESSRAFDIKLVGQTRESIASF